MASGHRTLEREQTPVSLRTVGRVAGAKETQNCGKSSRG
jgi:hypothetical protein